MGASQSSKEMVKGFGEAMIFATIIAFVYATYAEKRLLDMPTFRFAIFPMWNMWLLGYLLDWAVPDLMDLSKNKWVRRAIVGIGLLFYVFMLYSAIKYMRDNRTVFINQNAKYYHTDLSCEDLDKDQEIIKDRQVEFEKYDKEPCITCQDDEAEDKD
jgi:hypothetical protein